MNNQEKRLFLHEAGHYVIGQLLGINVVNIQIRRKSNGSTEGGVQYDESAYQTIFETGTNEEIDEFLLKHCKKDAAGAISGYLSIDINLSNFNDIFNDFKNKEYNKSDYKKFSNNLDDLKEILNIKHDQKQIIIETINLVLANKDRIFKIANLLDQRYSNSIGNLTLQKNEIDNC